MPVGIGYQHGNLHKGAAFMGSAAPFLFNEERKTPYECKYTAAANGIGLVRRARDYCERLHYWNARAADGVELRGYGKVSASVTPEQSEFTCESDAKADILLGKLLADLSWDSKYVEKTIPLSGRNLLIRITPSYGALIAGRDGNRVFVAGGSTEEEAVILARKNPGFLSPSFQSKPSRPYPIYLDYYDLRAFKDYVNGMSATPKQYISQFFGGMGGEMGKKAQFAMTPADGVVPWASLDYEMASAEKQGVMYVPGVGSGIWPTWAWNKCPQYIAAESSLSINGGGSSSGCGTSGYEANPESSGLPRQIREATSLAFVKKVMQRFLASPALGGWQLYCGQYMYEMNFGCDVIDHSALGQEGFRKWLRDVRGLSLAALGERWHGDAGHFKDWSEVMRPERDSFVGNFGDDCFRISQGWFWKNAPQAEAVPPADEAPGWVPVAMAPSRQMETLPNGPAFWRVQFDATGWLKQNAGKDLYLVCDLNNFGWRSYSVFMNGKALGSFKSQVRPFNGPISLKVTDLLAQGANHLSFSIPDGPSADTLWARVSHHHPAGWLSLSRAAPERAICGYDGMAHLLAQPKGEGRARDGRGVDPTGLFSSRARMW